MPAALLVYDDDMPVAANDRARQLLRLGSEASLAQLRHTLDPDHCLAAMLEAAGPEGAAMECRLHDGTRLRLRVQGVPVASRPGRRVVVLEDIGPREDSERQLQRRLLFERLLTEASAALIRSDDEALDLVVVNMLGSIGSFFGVDRAYVFLIDECAQTQSNTHEWVAAGISREAPNLQDVPLTTFPWLLQQLRADRVFRVEDVAALPPEAANERSEFEREGIQSLLVVPLWTGLRLDGFVGFDAVRHRVEWGEHYVIGLRLMTQMISNALEARAMSRRLHMLAFQDPLTGLPNRKRLEDDFTIASRVAGAAPERIVVAVVDVDNFKQINDTHGHAVGDRVLCEIGRRLQGVMRETDTVARIGGDEFVVVAHRLDAAGLSRLADRLLTACATPVEVDGLELRLGLSVGLVRASDGAEALDGLLRKADLAMYRAKAEGKNRWVESLADEVDF
ncbi:GGDEF domain-containing protein [Agrilutibacter solisilvae]|uniref:Diguanylate cyclase n=1 Tax=Agrilutibacter solisilvae TaxID=2763317 RepID=A0A974XYZ5_9GAMM|nr:GGDEF domain-containing protein [Lysobacter solisilvae]QSX77540.1 diguanylate cyclase [Lysobacter solisilvae]